LEYATVPGKTEIGIMNHTIGMRAERNTLLGVIYFVGMLAGPAPDAFADEPVQLETIEVIERSDTLIGIGDSATQGTVGPRQLEARPLLRPGEALETVPGVIITQHSGSGKANQFFLRGFNLDHGTDFRSRGCRSIFPPTATVRAIPI
jgi:TonB-dependent Receptor Plug Domain